MIQVLLVALVAGLCVVSAGPIALGQSVPEPVVVEEHLLPTVELPIIEMPSPHQDDRPPGTVIDAIVVHDTETPGVTEATTIVNWFKHPRSKVSAHYIIGKRGELIQCVPDARRAWHAGPSKLGDREKVNDFSIGIELVNAQTGRDPFTEAQHRTLALLTADLVMRYQIPLDRIVGHRDVTYYPKIKKDPADNFDWARYLADVEGLLTTKQVVRQIKTAAVAPGAVKPTAP
jgi:N-acetylmuramoyl-L-alanine amidase